MQHLNTAPVFAVKWSLYAFLVFIWLLTIQGLLSHNERVIPFCYILPPISILIPWWLRGFKQATISEHSLFVRGSKREARVPIELAKQVSAHRWGRGFAHVTVIFKSETPFGRRIRVKTHWSDCDHIASLIRKATEVGK
jgi:hypothetical protein